LGIQAEEPRHEHEEVGVDDIELGEVGKKDDEADMSEKFMSDFFEEVNEIKTKLALITKNISQLDKVSKDVIVSVSLESANKSNELEKLIDETNLEAGGVRDKLKEMGEQNKNWKRIKRK